MHPQWHCPVCGKNYGPNAELPTADQMCPDCQAKPAATSAANVQHTLDVKRAAEKPPVPSQKAPNPPQHPYQPRKKH